ncbi:hypothetical protein GALL_506860 [mine drainage metagenome]|uniref:Uncharacterized protein n=1 Tax=mine drainage metagenome TaxID=410659 RepID=A0A1J5P910_9ZZZZ
MLGSDQLAGLITIKLHTVYFAQQVVRKLDVRLVDFVNQQRYRLFSGKGLPQHAFDNVVVDVFNTLATVNV